MNEVVKRFTNNGSPSWKVVAVVSIGLTATLITALWGITWAAIQNDVAALEQKVNVNEGKLGEVKVHLEYIKRSLDEIKKQLDKLIGMEGG